jgi:hypothetical protein
MFLIFVKKVRIFSTCLVRTNVGSPVWIKKTPHCYETTTLIYL